MSRYRDRRDAGRLLARRLGRYAHREDVVVLALARGGVPVAYEVARALGAPLDVFIVRKLGTPGQPELALGAIASGNVRVLNEGLVAQLGITDEELEKITAQERTEIERRERTYRRGRPEPELEGRTIILVDDGLATGATMRAAIAALRQHHPRALVVGVPIAAPTACASVGSEVEDIVCTATPEPFYGVGLWYDAFTQTTDDEVRALLERAAREHAGRGVAPSEHWT